MESIKKKKNSGPELTILETKRTLENGGRGRGQGSSWGGVSIFIHL